MINVACPSTRFAVETARRWMVMLLDHAPGGARDQSQLIDDLSESIAYE